MVRETFNIVEKNLFTAVLRTGSERHYDNFSKEKVR